MPKPHRSNARKNIDGVNPVENESIGMTENTEEDIWSSVEENLAARDGRERPERWKFFGK